jgi:hypothetical protein
VVGDALRIGLREADLDLGLKAEFHEANSLRSARWTRLLSPV